MSIPCRISDYGDVISSYSVENLETLNPDFTDYVKEVAEVTPDDLPIVLNVVGGGLTQAQQKTIEETILDDFAYDLGVVEKKECRHTWIFWSMLVILVVMGIVIELVGEEVGIPRDFCTSCSGLREIRWLTTSSLPGMTCVRTESWPDDSRA